MTTSAARHKSLTTNSINFSGLEYLWMPAVPQRTIFCLGLNTRPVPALMARRAGEHRGGGLLSFGHKQNGPPRSKRSNTCDSDSHGSRCSRFLTLIKSSDQTRELTGSENHLGLYELIIIIIRSHLEVPLPTWFSAKDATSVQLLR